MIYLGIDPGKNGGLAALTDDGVPFGVAPMPLLKGDCDQHDPYDLVTIRRTLIARKRESDGQVFATVEKSTPMPGKFKGAGGKTISSSGYSQFGRGVARGWRWILEALEIEYQLVAPITWQSAMLAGAPGETTKQQAAAVAKRLFPRFELRPPPPATKMHEGMVDAILIAEWGRRKHKSESLELWPVAR